MPFYDYECLDCLDAGHEARPFLAYYGLSATPEEKEEKTACPECGGHNTHQVYSTPHVSVRTKDWQTYRAKNKAAMVRDYDLHLLKSGNDPFAEHRTADETAEKIDRLEKSKQTNPKRQYFT